MILQTSALTNTFDSEYLDMQAECMAYGHVCTAKTVAEHLQLERSGAVGSFLPSDVVCNEQFLSDLCERLTIHAFVGLDDWELFSKAVASAKNKNIPLCMPIKKQKHLSATLSVPHIYDFSNQESTIDPNSIDWDLTTLLIVNEKQAVEVKEMRNQRTKRLIPIMKKYDSENELRDFRTTESEGSFISLTPDENLFDRFMVSFLKGFNHPRLIQNTTLDPNKIQLGILAINGEFLVHLEKFEQAPFASLIQVSLINRPEDLDKVAALLAPGGSSAHMCRLIDLLGFRPALEAFTKTGKPITGTCAGGISFGKKNISGCDNRNLVKIANGGVENSILQGPVEGTNLITGEMGIYYCSDGPVFHALPGSNVKPLVLDNQGHVLVLHDLDSNVVLSAIHDGPLIHQGLVQRAVEYLAGQFNQSQVAVS